MANITVSLRVHETSTPLPDLLVTWYSTKAFNIPKDFLEPKNWEALKRSNWKGINPTRLGSAFSGVDGIARLKLLSDEIHENERPPLNLWFTVQQAEIAGVSNSGSIVYLANQVTANFSDHEEMAVRFPQDLIERLRIGKRTSSFIGSQISATDFDLSLEKVENGLKARLDAQPENNMFAERFNETIFSVNKEREKISAHPIIPMSIFLPINVRKSNSSRKPKIRFDKNKKRLVIGSNTSVKSLSYDGIVRYTNNSLTKLSIKKTQVLLDEKTGKLKFSLPEVPEILELTETEPSALFMQSRLINN